MKKTIKDVYIVSIIKEGGDVIQLSDDISINMREREGNSYVNFFNLVKIEIAPEESNYTIGQELLVHHYISDQVAELEKGKETYLCYEEQIMGFKARDIFPKSSNDYIKNFDAIDGYLTEPIGMQNEFSDGLNSRELYEPNCSVSFDGDKLEYITSADYEIFYNETLFFYVKKENCFLVNDEVTDNFLELVIQNNVMASEYGDVLARDSDVQISLNGRTFIRRDLIGAFAF